jgi:hypothetical protein
MMQLLLWQESTCASWQLVDAILTEEASKRLG